VAALKRLLIRRQYNLTTWGAFEVTLGDYISAREAAAVAAAADEEAAAADEQRSRF
jgi:hypothetical protein